jgi:hypothetical protein
MVVWIDQYRNGPTRVILFSDNFNRANSATLGASWTPDTSNFTITSNAAQMAGTGAPQLERVVTTMGSPDHWVEATVLPPSTVNPWVSAIAARMDPSAGNTHYAAWKQGNAAIGARIVLSRGTAANAYTTVATGSDGSGAAAGAAAQLVLEVEGTALRVYQFYAAAYHLVISTTDATYSVGNNVGMTGFRTTGTTQVEDYFAGTGYL